MIWTLKKLRQRREDILRIARHHGVVSLKVIGSVARGDATNSSDVDFIASFEEGRSLMDVGELIMDLEESLACPVDVISEKALSATSLAETESEAVAL